MISSLNKVCVVFISGLLISHSVFADDATKPLLKTSLNKFMNESYEFKMVSVSKKSPNNQANVPLNQSDMHHQDIFSQYFSSVFGSGLNILGNAKYELNGGWNKPKKLLSGNINFSTQSHNVETEIKFPFLLDLQSYQAITGVTEFNALAIPESNKPIKDFNKKYIRFKLPETMRGMFEEESFKKQVSEKSDVFISALIDALPEDKLNFDSISSGDKGIVNWQKIKVTANQIEWQSAALKGMQAIANLDRIPDSDNEDELETSTYQNTFTDRTLDQILEENISLYCLIQSSECSVESKKAIKEYLEKPIEVALYFDQSQRLTQIKTEQTSPLRVFFPFLDNKFDLNSDTTLTFKYTRSPKLPFNPRESSIINYDDYDTSKNNDVDSTQAESEEVEESTADYDDEANDTSASDYDCDCSPEAVEASDED